MGDFSVWTRPGGVGSGATGLTATQELANRERMRYERGITRIGRLEVDVIALAGATAPAAGDYIEVRYSTGSSTPWSGVVREVRKAQHDTDLYHVTAFDALGEIDKRNVDARRSYTSTDERTILIDILSQIGITTTSHPVRYQTNSILAGGSGNAVDSYRSEYDDGLAAIRALAVTYGREVTWVREANGSGGFVWTLSYLNRAPDATKSSVVQATLQAGLELDALTDITDDLDKATGVRVVGYGDGTDAPSGTAGTTGGANATFAVPARSVRSASVAGSLASTLQSTFSANRRVLVAPTGYADPVQDGGVDLGYLVTLKDEAGTSVGNYRVMHLEVDEEYANGWFSRVTLITSTIPALPSVSTPAGVRPPGILDITQLDLEHKLQTQRSDSTRLGASAVLSTQPAVSASAALAANAGRSLTLNFTTRSFVVGTDEGLQLFPQVFTLDTGTSNGISAAFDVTLTLAGTNVFEGRFTTTAGGVGVAGRLEVPIFLSAKFLADVLGIAGTATAATLTVTNRAGTTVDVTMQLSGHVVPQHAHNP